MALEIRTTSALIGVDRTPFRLEIQTQDARLELHQKHARINIQTELPRVEIDQYEAFASAGLKGNADIAREAAQLGYQQAMSYIKKKTDDGAALAAIEKGGNPIPSIVVRDAYPVHEFGLDYIPKVGPKITVKGSVQLDPERNSEGVNNGVEGNYVPGNVDVNFTPARVSVFLRQYASISISHVGTKLNTYI